ncbi:MAG: hypothetical protein AABO57_07265 [Acidobacteriota bacterium]
MPINIQSSVGSGGANKPDDIRAVKERLIELGFDWLADEDDIERVDQLAIDTIKLFQTIKQGLNTITGDGRVDVNGDTLKWLQASNAPRWQTMPAGSRAEGFINDELADHSDNHDFGTNWLADTLRDAGAKYKADFLSLHPTAAVLSINDTSLPRGGFTRAHATHQSGLASDIRLPRKDGRVGGITVAAAAYDRSAMRAMLKAFLAQPLAKRVLLNDSVLIAERLCSHAAGHDNHAHFEVKPPARVMGT